MLSEREARAQCETRAEDRQDDLIQLLCAAAAAADDDMMMDMKLVFSPVGSPSLHAPVLLWAPQEMVTCTRRCFALEPFSPRLISPTALTSAIKCDSCAQPV